MVTGSGRSGTTWLAKLLDSHPAVLYRHEPDSVMVNSDIPFMPRAADVGRYVDQSERYLRELLAVRSLKSIGHQPFFPKDYRGFLGQAAFLGCLYAGKGLEACWSRLGGRNAARWQMPEFVSADGAREALPVIKTVDSLCRTYLFSQADPRIRFVHIVRHPGGVIASRLRGQREGLMRVRVFLQALFDSGDAAHYSSSLEEIDSRTIEEQLTFQWLVQNGKVMREMRSSKHYLPVAYEALCRDPIGMTRRVFDFCGLDWNVQTERFIGALGRYSSRAGYFSVMRSPADAPDQWKKELAPAARERIEHILEGSEPGVLVMGGDE